MDSRIEQLLEALLSGSAVDITPQSRNEMYLLAMINGSTDVPEPRTRAEAYFYALAKNGTGGGGSGGGAGNPLDEYFADTLTEYTNNTVTELRLYAFYRKKNLVSVNFPEVLTLGASTFEYCEKLETANMPKLQKLGSSALLGCKALKRAYFPMVTNAGDSYTFSGCTSLEEVYFPLATGTFQTYFFNNCTNLHTVTFSPTTISSKVFDNCANLKTLVMPNISKVPTLPVIATFNGTPFAEGGSGGTVYCPAALIEGFQTATNWSALYAAGTCNFVAIEGSEYE